MLNSKPGDGNFISDFVLFLIDAETTWKKFYQILRIQTDGIKNLSGFSKIKTE